MPIAVGQTTISDLNDALSGVLSNDAHTISTLPDGTGGSYAGAVSIMSIYNGAIDDSANWAVTVAVSNVTGSLAGKQYTVASLTADTGYVDFTATRAGYSNIVKRFTLTRSKQGTTGAGGSAGLPAYVHIAYATSSDGSVGFSTTVSAGKTFMGTYSDNTVADSSNPALYSWTLIKGDKGDIGDPNTTQITNAVTTVDSTGITVKDGNFGLETTAGGTHKVYNNVGTLTATRAFKNHLFTLPNMVYDHSFEMAERNGTLIASTNHYYLLPSTVEIFGKWGTTGSPRLVSYYDTDFAIPVVPFAHQMAMVNSTNSVKQGISVEPNVAYTFSFHLKKAFELTSATTAEVHVKYFDGFGTPVGTAITSSYTVPTTDVSNSSVRHSLTFTAPSNLPSLGYAEIHLRTVGTGYACFDGIQMVLGDKACLYYPDDEAWKIRRGGMDKYPIIDAPTSGILNVHSIKINSTGDASGTSTDHGLSIGNDITGSSMKMDTNEISYFLNGVTGQLNINPDGGTVAFFNSATNKVTFTDGKVSPTNAKTTNGYNSVTVRDGTVIHDDHMLIQNLAVSVTLTASQYQDFTDITFPTAFTSILWAVATPQNSNASSYITAIYNQTATGCRVYARHVDSTLGAITISIQLVACGRKA